MTMLELLNALLNAAEEHEFDRHSAPALYEIKARLVEIYVLGGSRTKLLIGDDITEED